MKKIITLFTIFLLCSVSLFAQVPQRFSYQAVVRNPSNQLVSNAPVGIRVSILSGGASGNVVYSETHTTATNANGLLTIEIGSGSVQEGVFSDIAWGEGMLFLKTEIDPIGGNNYSITSVQQLLSVPYALYAKEAANSFSGDYNDLSNKPQIPTVPTNVSAFSNDAGYLNSYTETDPQFNAWDKDYNDLINKPTIPTVPESVSVFVNDAGYLTAYTENQSLADVTAQGNSAGNRQLKDVSDPTESYDAVNLRSLNWMLDSLRTEFQQMLQQQQGQMQRQIDSLMEVINAQQSDSSASADSIQASLPVVTTNPVTSITASSIICGGNVTSDGGAIVTARGLCWSATQNPTVNGSHTADGSGSGGFISNITGLMPNTTYYVRAYATNRVGTAYGTEMSFTTAIEFVPSVSNNGPYCIGDTIHLFCDNPMEGASYLWTGPDDWTSSEMAPVIYPATLDMNGNAYTLVMSLNGGNTSPVSTMIEMYRTNVSVGPSQSTTICEGETVTLTAENPGLVVLKEDFNIYTQDNSTAGSGDVSTFPTMMNVSTDVGGVILGRRTIANTTTGEITSIPLDLTSDFQVTVRAKKRDANDVVMYVEVGGVSQPRTVTGSDYADYVFSFTGQPGWGNEAIHIYNEQHGNGTAGANKRLSITDVQVEMNCTYTWTVTPAMPIADSHAQSITVSPNTTTVFSLHQTSGNCAGDTSITITTVSCVDDGQPCPDEPTVTDIDGNVYNTVQIGNQCWMRENLRTIRFADGTIIPAGGSTSSSTSAYRYCPNNDSSTVSTYGYLYNWVATMHGASSSNANPSGVQGICPTGWHVPSFAEWMQLTKYVSSQSQYVCGSNSSTFLFYIAKALAANTGWPIVTSTCAVGNNQSANNATGFSALPAGFYESSFGSYLDYSFDSFGSSASFWSSTQANSSTAWGWFLDYTDIYMRSDYPDKSDGSSVRCLRDMVTGMDTSSSTILSDSVVIDAKSCPSNPTVTDNEGNVYATVQIGDQCWMRENLRTTKKPDGTDIPLDSGRYYPNNDTNNVAVYGYLYTWNAIMNSAISISNTSVQGICPTGWHIPIDAEWTQLISYVSSQNQYVCGNVNIFIAKALAATTGWSPSASTCAVGNDQSANNATGFSALPAGSYNNGYYYDFGSDVGSRAWFWSYKDINNIAFVHGRYLVYDDAYINEGNDDENSGYSVRCLRD